MLVQNWNVNITLVMKTRLAQTWENVRVWLRETRRMLLEDAVGWQIEDQSLTTKSSSQVGAMHALGSVQYPTIYSDAGTKVISRFWHPSIDN